MIQNALQTAAARLIRPLVRMLLRHGVSYADFSEVVRRVYVDVAASDFPLEGRKQTHARIAMLTGINRKEIGRLRSLPGLDNTELDLQYNRGVRVISGWRRDKDFQNPAGEPRALSMEGGASFSELVRRYSGDLTARAVLDELRRLGSVTVNEENLVCLTPDAVHVPLEDLEAQFNIMGSAGSDLLRTIDHNLEAPAHDKRLQLTVAYNNLPEAAARRFQHISHEDSMVLLKKFDAWLAEHDRDANPTGAETEGGRFRAGIGIYYFEEEVQ